MAATNTLTNLVEQVSQASDIRDIPPLVDIPNPWIWVWVALGLLAAVAIAGWLWLRARRQGPAIPVPPPTPAHVLARQRLEGALALIHQPKPFIIAVSDTLRAYLEGAFELRAPEQTTEEFLVELQHSARLSEAQKNSLGDFLQSCDMVKFARYEPRESELSELHAYAVELVAQTEPAPEMAPPSENRGEFPPATAAGATSSENDRPL
jgi:hypothetical protein